MKKAIYYLNNYFAQIGGEEKADIPFEAVDGAIGPAVAFQEATKGKVQVVKTVYCGDNTMTTETGKVRTQLRAVLEEHKPDIFIAGPAFNAGRYGIACGEVCMLAAEMGIPAFSGMYKENPGYEMYRPFAFIVETNDNASGMRKAIPALANIVTSYLDTGAEGIHDIKGFEIEGYLPRNIRVNYFSNKKGAKRAVDMLVKKLNNESFVTEYPMPTFDRVPPNPAIKDISKVKIALVTSGGVVPKGNPDHIEASSASKFGKYSFSKDFNGVLSAQTGQTAHGGYDPSYCNENPNRVLPYDILREFESQGKIGALHDYFYATVGNGTGVSSSKHYGEEIAKELKNDGVEAVILTST